MKSVMLSIKPKWVDKIVKGEKTIEVRKTAPKEVPFKAYIYETKESKRRYLDDRFNSFLDNKSHYTDMGKVIGEFVCDKVYLIKNQGSRFSVADEEQTDLKSYDKPEELSKFFTPMGKRPSYMIERPPQSYMYVEEL